MDVFFSQHIEDTLGSEVEQLRRSNAARGGEVEELRAKLSSVEVTGAKVGAARDALEASLQAARQEEAQFRRDAEATLSELRQRCASLDEKASESAKEVSSPTPNLSDRSIANSQKNMPTDGNNRYFTIVDRLIILSSVAFIHGLYLIEPLFFSDSTRM
jgi:DNA repair exonuclease SbcCD ATPase subunit